MNSKYRVTFFTYNFPHKKSHDFLVELKLSGVNVVSVIAAPFIDIKKVSNFIGYTPLSQLQALPPKDLCDAFNYNFNVCAHNDFPEMSNIINSSKSNIAIIGGGRILKKFIIELFSNGIINYHPGKIPETSGLDSFYWMLKKTVLPCSTVHFIDERIDAGRIIFTKNVEIINSDTLSTVSYKLYLSQLKAHRKICRKLKNNEVIQSKKLYNVLINKPMIDLERKEALGKFYLWKDHAIHTTK